MTNLHTKESIAKSLIWKMLERIGVKGIQFIVQIVLARILMPEDYGKIALVMVITTLAGILVQSGLNTALIQKRDSDNLDFSTVFFISLAMSIVIYVIVFLLSPSIAIFYGHMELVPVIRVLATIIIIGSFNSIQNAYIAKKMLFRDLMFSSIWAAILSGTVGIVMAIFGFGIWALVVQQLLNIIIVTLVLYVRIPWRPQAIHSFSRLKSLFSFGYKLLLASILNELYMNLRALIIGKLYKAETLAYYNRGKQFPQLIVENLNGSIISVLFPAQAMHQNDLVKVKSLLRRSITTSSVIIFPMIAGLIAVAEPLVIILLTDKWIETVPFLRIYCLIYAMKPLYVANTQTMNALGKSEIFLKLEIITTLIGIVTLVISISFGVLGIAYGALISSIISMLIYMKPNKKLIDYGFLEQIKDIMPVMLVSLMMVAVLFSIDLLSLSSWWELTIKILLGVTSYFFMLTLFKVESYTYLISTIKEIYTKEKKVKREK